MSDLLREEFYCHVCAEILHREDFSAHLQNCTLFSTERLTCIKHIGGGGNCFYRCLSQVMYGRQDLYQDIRLNIINFMAQFEDQYIKNLRINKDYEAEDNDDYKKYLRRHSREGEWVDDTVVQASADYYGVTIFISMYHFNNSKMTRKQTREIKPVQCKQDEWIHLRLKHRHYDIISDSSKMRAPKPAMAFEFQFSMDRKENDTYLNMKEKKNWHQHDQSQMQQTAKMVSESERGETSSSRTAHTDVQSMAYGGKLKVLCIEVEGTEEETELSRRLADAGGRNILKDKICERNDLKKKDTISVRCKDFPKKNWAEGKDHPMEDNGDIAGTESAKGRDHPMEVDAVGRILKDNDDIAGTESEKGRDHPMEVDAVGHILKDNDDIAGTDSAKGRDHPMEVDAVGLILKNNGDIAGTDSAKGRDHPMEVDAVGRILKDNDDIAGTESEKGRDHPMEVDAVGHILKDNDDIAGTDSAKGRDHPMEVDAVGLILKNNGDIAGTDSAKGRDHPMEVDAVGRILKDNDDIAGTESAKGRDHPMEVDAVDHILKDNGDIAGTSCAEGNDNAMEVDEDDMSENL